MMPMYMNSSSQPGQMRGFGNYPQHMTMDASSPGSCEHWPAPSPCYGSCIHGSFPAYSGYWSPCYPPQVPYHPCCINYSGFHPHASHAPPSYVHQPFPAGYQPWFDSDKDVPGKHRCTNCSPQMCYPKNDRSVVIEEHEPETEKVDHREAAKPVRSTICPYPIIWIPHENARNQEHGNPRGSGSHDHPSAEVKVPESTKVQKTDPESWNGCFPFDENTLKSLIQNLDRKKMQNCNSVELPFDVGKLKSLQGQDGKEVQMQKNKEPGQLSYPVIWIPSHGNQEEVKASENWERSNEGPNSNPKSFPSDLLVKEGQVAQHKGEGNIECKVLSDADEKSSMRNIPVEDHQQEPRNIPVKLLENHLPKPSEPTKSTAKTELAEKTKKEQPSSPPRASRLPPVCLRVDPFPKRKNGGSKSLSPPRRKEQPLTSEDAKVASPLRPKKAETVAEPCTVKSQEANKEKKMSERRLNAAATEKESVEHNSNLQGANCDIVKPCESKENREKPARKTFTEDEAARTIQSWYRGYDVRRWEPLKKLKEIVTVREQMGDVKKRIQALEVSSDQRIEEKEIIILGEMVMSLLIKLDSVQGLHSSIRDHRKSLARELSDIQEKLDSMRKSSTIAEEKAVKEQVEITSQTSDSPVNLEHSQLAEENKMELDSNTEKVLLPSPEEHPTSVMNGTDEQLAAEAEEGTGLFETLATDLEPATDTGICEAVPTPKTAPEKIGEVEIVVPINLPSADGNVMAVTKSEEDKAVVESLEESQLELPRVVEATREAGLNATEISESEANASENEDRKEDDGTVLPSEKDVELSELPVGVIDDEMEVLSRELSSSTHDEKLTPVDPEAEATALEYVDRKEECETILLSEKDVELSDLPAGAIDDEKQLLSQDSSSCTREVEKTEMDAETASPKGSGIDHSSEDSKGIDQETCEPQEEKEQWAETKVIVEEHPREESEVIEHEIPEETKRLMEENQRFKETMETLVKASREQLEVISKLTGRVKSLEKKLSQKKRTQTGRRKILPCKASCETNVK